MRDVTAQAVWEEFKQWLKHPSVVSRIEKAAFVTETAWVKNAFELEVAILPTLSGATFSLDEKDKALAWLRSEEKSQSRLDLSFAQLAEFGTLKAAGGFAIGLLLAANWSSQRRQKIGWAVMLSALVAGLPLSVQLLNRLKSR